MQERTRSGLHSAFLEWRQRTRVSPALARGPLAPFWDDLAAWMFDRGYRWITVLRTVEIARPFASYAERRGIRDASQLSTCLADRYLKRHPRRREGRSCLDRVLAFLRARGVLRAPASPVAAEGSPLLNGYSDFLRRHRGVGEDTIGKHRKHVQIFLAAFGAEDHPQAVGDLEAGAISRFVTARAEALSPNQRKELCATLRSFLRFLQLHGHLPRDLVSVVPVIPTFKLDRLPRAATVEDIEKILAVVDRSTPTGRRDYPILLLLATYGIRCGQIRALRLEDLDWRRQLLRIRAAKGGRDAVLPLRSEVGEALVEYLRNARPPSSLREVFLRVLAPVAPLGSAVTGIIQRYARKAGVTGRISAHAWRFACASRMLSRGSSLKTIRDVLGHRSIETTFVYTKINIEELRQASLDWPWAAS